MQTEPECISLRNETVHAWHIKRSNETLFFIHGYPGRPQDFAKLIDAFSEFSVLAVALPGFGITPSTNIDSLSHSHFSAICFELIDALGIDQVHLIGHSFGGALACSLASSRDSRIRSLTLISSVGLRPHRALRMGIRNMYSVLSLPVFTRMRPIILQWFFRVAGFPKKLTPEAMWLSCRLVSEFSFSNHAEVVSQIHSQTLIVHSKNDPFIETEIATELTEKIRRARLVLLEDGKHNPQHSKSHTIANHINEMIKSMEEK